MYFQEAKLEGETDSQFCKRTFEKLSTEDDPKYIERVFNKYDNENETSYLKRIRTVLKVFQNQELWYDTKYLPITKEFFINEYEQREDETLNNYYRRLLKKKTYETFETYRKRIKILRELFPNLRCWKNYKEDQSSRDGYTLAASPPKTANPSSSYGSLVSKLLIYI